LGATIRFEGEAVIIGRIVRGGAAEKCGALHEGDEILEVNGRSVRGKDLNDICAMLSTLTGTLTFTVSPRHIPRPPPTPVPTPMKSHFDYDPEDDVYLPCKELGMSFQKGDILHIMSQQDPHWWQAVREGEEENSLAGLIPSRMLQETREAVKQTVMGDVDAAPPKKGNSLLCARRRGKKGRKKSDALFGAGEDPEEVLTYEEVHLLYPSANRKRPLVLVGPPKIGRHELRQRMMEDRERFAAAVPHTSRPRREAETHGVDYFFTSRAQFEQDIAAGAFVEHGEYEKAYYGTSHAAIQAVIAAGKTCALNLHAASLAAVRTRQLRPFVVFVAPPSMAELRARRVRAGEPAKDEELKDIMDMAHRMEERYGHLFDLVLVNRDTNDTYDTLLQQVAMLEREPQWVPATWDG